MSSQLLEEEPVSTVQDDEGWALDTEPVDPSPLSSAYEMLWVMQEVGYCEFKRFHGLTVIQKCVFVSIVVVQYPLISFTPLWFGITVNLIITLLLLYTGSRRELY
jgi:hypothetical protein